MSITTSELIQRARDLAPILAQHASEAERERKPANAVIEAMREARIFDLMVPRIYGGLEFDLDPGVGWDLPKECPVRRSPRAWFCARNAGTARNQPDRHKAKPKSRTTSGSTCPNMLVAATNKCPEVCSI